MNHRNFYRRQFRDAVVAGGLPARLRFHDLRHTCAALLVGQGAHPLVVMKRLGHSSTTVTMNTCGHMFPVLEESVTDGLDRIWGPDTTKRTRPVGHGWGATPPKPGRRRADLSRFIGADLLFCVVAGTGVDPVTPRFSGVCSAD